MTTSTPTARYVETIENPFINLLRWVSVPLFLGILLGIITHTTIHYSSLNPGHMMVIGTFFGAALIWLRFMLILEYTPKRKPLVRIKPLVYLVNIAIGVAILGVAALIAEDVLATTTEALDTEKYLTSHLESFSLLMVNPLLGSLAIYLGLIGLAFLLPFRRQ